MQYLTIWDAILGPIYLLILSLIAKSYRDKHYPKGHALRKYYLPGLFVKFGGAIFIALIYEFYYKGGDTFGYLKHSQIINSTLDSSINTWLRLLFHTSLTSDPTLYPYVIQMPYYNDASSYTVASIAAVLGLLNGTTYIPIALLFAFISYSGVWVLFRTFTNIYPTLHKPFAISFLFIPSVFIWGSAVFKDTVCLFAIGWLTYSTFQIFINRKFSLQNLLILVLTLYFISVIKIYILLAFLPALGLWLLMTYSHRIKSPGVRFIISIFSIGLIVWGFFFFTQRLAKELKQYSLEKVAQTSNITREYISYMSGDEGSSYDLGVFAPTLGGMLSKFPGAVVVTLYRPFIWESKKVISFLSAVESMAFLYFTLFVLFKVGLRTTLKKISSDPNILFCLVFSLIFAFAVGVSSYNFGALSRYKIPCLPFYAAFLVLLYKEKFQKPQLKKINRIRKFQHSI